ncbi:hypothetical protein K493DRAFT_308989 [Basidiobolus meristosporus CBS 931.73]|uniref:DUF5077 domain-containing protein n=1 Tax=Basidiobolus meristosporus CBS 931.73 TaxID=1314790 RepID=A0A1Y1WTK7_9FUNG|nr:hypothetical protein K493DRAFT_308989 [Basidiobolus meristosporus CBS 931.73]|eukprot:ORX76725.1 hypothetical protein K493DRAFT_308989 [Basidiobolus meristosporus CBS 931.73]
MKAVYYAFSIIALFPLQALLVAIHSLPYLEHGHKYTSFETDVAAVPGYSPDITFYMATGWDNGYLGMQVGNKDRRFLFSLWDGEQDAEVVEICEKCESSGFAHEGTGRHIWLVYPWVDGHKYRFKVDYHRDGDYNVYTGSVKITDQWEKLGVLRVSSPKDNGLGYFYQFLENWLGDKSQPRTGLYSSQCYRVEGDDFCYPCLGTTINYTKPRYRHEVGFLSWGAGYNKEHNGVWMSINGPLDNPYNNNIKEHARFPYDQCNIEY